jgi:AraC-like DNA-binding protein
MPWSSVARFSDPEACRQAIQGLAGVEIFPATRGNFNTEVTKIRFDRIWMQRIEFSLPQIMACKYPSDRQVITFPTEPGAPKSFFCGAEVSAGDVSVSRSDMIHRKCDANYRSGSMSLPKCELHSVFKAVTGYDFREESGVRIVRPDPGLISQLLKLHQAIGKLAHDTPEVLEIPEVGRALEQKLIHFMVLCLGGDVLHLPTTRSRGDAIMIKFEEFLEANCDRLLYLPEVCAALGVAERSLRSYCEEHLGMGPIRYLALRRMHLVHRALRRAESSQTTITRVVTDHGFWELGRFAVAYRALFGESPSETLRRPGERAEFALNRPSSLAFTDPSKREH